MTQEHGRSPAPSSGNKNKPLGQNSDQSPAPPNAAEAALEFIYLTDWGWRGRGSEERLSGRAGELARQVLGLPPLPRGWSAEPLGSRLCELRQIIDVGIASAIEARRAETQGGSVADEHAVPKADAHE